MEKLLFTITLLCATLFSYNISQAKTNAKPGTYGHVVYNVHYYNKSRTVCLSPVRSADMAELYLTNHTGGPTKWYIQYLDVKYKKFWYSDQSWFAKWRILDIDWRNNISRTVIWPVNGDPNQEWELIGFGNILSYDETDAFEGVIINRKSGRMLEAFMSQGVKQGSIKAEKLWSGSNEQKAYTQNNSFSDLQDKRSIWRIWKYYTY